ncbi:MAG TPA: hypothetical protein VG324_26425 [Blastocatellia bacterium]|nr:hypothetical protein [Blastocatellia bacterium]
MSDHEPNRKDQPGSQPEVAASTPDPASSTGSDIRTGTFGTPEDILFALRGVRTSPQWDHEVDPNRFREWLRRKNIALRQAMERREVKFVVDYMAMFSEMFSDATLDERNASSELADAFDNTATVLKIYGDHSKAESFVSRALAIRHTLDRGVLEEMLAKPMVIPDVVLPAEGFFHFLHKDVIAGIWQRCELPRQTLAWTVAVDQPWRYCAAMGNLVFWLFDLESTTKDEHQRTGRDMCLRMAKKPSFQVQPDTTGKIIREQVLYRGVMRVRRSAVGQTPEWMLVGCYLSRLLYPQSNRRDEQNH